MVDIDRLLNIHIIENSPYYIHVFGILSTWTLIVLNFFFFEQSYSTLLVPYRKGHTPNNLVKLSFVLTFRSMKPFLPLVWLYMRFLLKKDEASVYLHHIPLINYFFPLVFCSRLHSSKVSTEKETLHCALSIK